MKAIKIVHWTQYEIKGDSRSPQVMAGPLKYVKLLIKPTGKKYIELMHRDEGEEAYGVFIILLIAWACQTRSKRKGGIIWSWHEGVPAEADEIARQLLCSQNKFDRCLPILCDIGWIELVEVNVKTPKTPKAAKPKPATVKSKATAPADIQELFNYWNSDSLVWADSEKKTRCRCPQTDEPWKVSQQITPDIIDNIKQHLKRWEIQTLQQSIDNYHYVLTSPDHPGWTFRWSISEFFGRHMPQDRSQFTFYRFLPDNFDETRYMGNR